MIINIQKFCSKTYNTSLNTIKGIKKCRDRREYNVYNLSILLCWLLRPTHKYGCKSLIARHHCCNKNRVFRLYKLYNSNDKFRSFVDKAKDGYTNNSSSW